MTLEDWLEQHPEKAQRFHERIGVSPMSLWRYRNGRHKPHHRIMAKIVRETAGAVTANDFFAAQPKRGAPGRGANAEKASIPHPLIGWMKGTFTIAPGIDFTAPAMPEWGEVAYGDKTWDDFK